MGRLSSREGAANVRDRYANRVKLYLESREDLKVLQERWFDDWGEWIEFVAADNPKGGGGGAVAVKRRVDQDRGNQLSAFGLVDRDSLLNKDFAGPDMGEVFFETDHAKFEAATRASSSHIKVLQRWEMENYLLNPAAMGEYVQDSNPATSPTLPMGQYLLEFSEEAVLLTAANLMLMDRGEGLLPAQFGLPKKPSERSLRERILLHLKERQVKSPGKTLDEKRAAIRAFLRDETGGPNEQWDQLNHLIDGKLFLERFCWQLKLQDSPRLHLARKIRDRNLIDSEIREFMETLKTEAKQRA